MINEDDIAYLPAHRAVELMGAGQLKPSHIMRVAIKRAKMAQNYTNCLTETFYTQAMKQAKYADSRYQNGLARPLEGIPLLVKEEAQVKGTSTTYCSLTIDDNKAKKTDIHVQRLMDAGAIMLAKTTTPEFCLLGNTHSNKYGVTTNPWNRKFTPGGSSGGTSAGLAMGAGMIGTGSDIGGSIRIPSGCSGTIGFKPPIGRVPENSLMALDYYSHVGPMARSVKDIALMMNIMGGQHPWDLTSLRDKITHKLDSTANDLRGVRIGYNLTLGHYRVEKQVKENTIEFLKKCESLGALVVEKPKCKIPKDLVFFAEAHVALISGNYTARAVREAPEKVTEYAKIMTQFQEQLTKFDMIRADEICYEFYQTFQQQTADCDIFICPTNAIAADRADGYPTLMDMNIDGQTRKGLDCYWYMTIPFNMLSRCPVLAMPSGFRRDGVPTGVQIVGKPYYDEPIIQFGMVVEQHSDWFGATQRPKIN